MPHQSMKALHHFTCTKSCWVFHFFPSTYTADNRTFCEVTQKPVWFTPLSKGTTNGRRSSTVTSRSPQGQQEIVKGRREQWKVHNSTNQSLHFGICRICPGSKLSSDGQRKMLCRCSRKIPETVVDLLEKISEVILTQQVISAAISMVLYRELVT